MGEKITDKSGVLKRKRLLKTSTTQYEEYLRIMENDSVFRTGTINPCICPKYVQEKWEELVTKLNACGNWPVLTMSEWKKRFNDWKNSTRAKYRKVVENSKATGGGPKLENYISQLEERGMAVWGKVAVTGSKCVPVTGGLQNISDSENLNTQLLTNLSSDTVELTCEANETPSIIIFQLYFTICIQTVQHKPSSSKDSVEVNAETTMKEKGLSCNKNLKRKPEQFLKTIGEELVNCYKEHLHDIEQKKIKLKEAKIELGKQKLALAEKKLKFEIAKYKFRF